MTQPAPRSGGRAPGHYAIVAICAAALGSVVTGAVMRSREALLEPPRSLPTSVLDAGTEPQSAPPTVKPGDELFAVDPKLVTHLSVVAAGWLFEAHRRDAAKDPFTLSFSTAKDGGVRTCAAGPFFDAVLAALTSLKARRAFTAAEGQQLRASPLSRQVRLTIADSSKLEPAEWVLVLPEPPEKHVMGFSDDLPTGADLDLERQSIDLLAQGCAALAATARRSDVRAK